MCSWGSEEPVFRDDPVHRAIVWFCGDTIDDLTLIADADERWALVGAIECADQTIIEPCSASEAIALTIECKSWDQDQIEFVCFHQWAPIDGCPDSISAGLEIFVQIVYLGRAHGFIFPVDLRDADPLVVCECCEDEGIERELGREGGVSEDGRGSLVGRGVAEMV